MNGPEDKRPIDTEVKNEAGMQHFEQALARAMKRVEVRAETTAKFFALAEEAERKRRHAGGGFRLIKLSNGGRVFTMPHPRGWMGGAIAAVLAMGCFVGAHIHTEHERRIQAERQFETAERITDQTLQRTREQLAQQGIQIEP